MEVRKIIKIPYGGCSETLVWQVGDPVIMIYGTYPNPFIKNLTDISGVTGKPFYEFILEKISEKL
jgi:hypothetical protein